MTYIRFHKPNCREDTRIFDTMWEAEEWAHSISNEIYGSVFDGYTTYDYKVAYALAFSLAEVKQFHVHAEKEVLEEQFVYKVWVVRNSIK